MNSRFRYHFLNKNPLNYFFCKFDQQKIFQKWLALGVDGFLLDQLDLLFEEEDLSVEEVEEETETTEDGDIIVSINKIFLFLYL